MRADRLVIVAMALIVAIAGPAGAVEPPDSTEIRAKVNELYTFWRAERGSEGFEDALSAKAAGLLEGVPLETCGVSQLKDLAPLLGQSEPHMAAAQARLVELSADESADGARAAFVILTIGGEPEDDALHAEVSRALRHPGLEELVRGGQGRIVFQALDRAPADVLGKHRDEVLAIANMVDASMDPLTVSSASGLATKMVEIPGLDSATTNAFRVRVIGLLTKAAAESDDKNIKKRLERQARFLEGAFARGQLMDHTAPGLTFQWSDPKGETVTSLAALEGNVVILDFWATWCGPCIASFPNMRDLQERYEGYDVVILGVTSLQGKHYPGGGAAAVDTEGAPEKEHDLMTAFMEDKDVTWRVAFAREDVFNPDYGVRGIPHVSIIGPDGKVRYNNLHPMDPMAEKCAKIDALLGKAGLRVPAPLAVVGEDGER